MSEGPPMTKERLQDLASRFEIHERRIPPRMRRPIRPRLVPRKKKTKRFVGIAKDFYGRAYGKDINGTFWRLDKLDFREIKYTVKKRGEN